MKPAHRFAKFVVLLSAGAFSCGSVQAAVLLTGGILAPLYLRRRQKKA